MKMSVKNIRERERETLVFMRVCVLREREREREGGKIANKSSTSVLIESLFKLPIST